MAAKKLRILVVTDVHDAVARVPQLADWLVAHNELVQLLLCAGDITTGYPAEARTSEAIAIIEGAVSSVLGALEQLASPVIYVPGNHDAACCFVDEPPSLSPNSFNAHRRWYALCQASRRLTANSFRLQDDLVVVGLGGAPPASQGDAEKWWAAFPYSNDADLVKAFAALKLEEPSRLETSNGPRALPEGRFRPRGPELLADFAGMVPTSSIDATDSVILLSHVGPSLSSTTIDSAEKPPVHSGSTALSAFALGPRARGVIVDIHGHAHRGRGLCHLGHLPIVNPGAFVEGHFALLTLEKAAGAALWQISSFELHTLPPLSPLSQ